MEPGVQLPFLNRVTTPGNPEIKNSIMKNQFREHWPVLLITAIVAIVIVKELANSPTGTEPVTASNNDTAGWTAPSLYTDQLLEGKERELVIYGEDLVANTDRYFGPHGSLQPMANVLHCQNCHLNAGRKEWGNSFAGVAANYPKYRERSGTVETIPKRVNDCFERSMNGKAIDTSGREMQAIVAYLKWVGQGVREGTKPKGSGINTLQYLDRAADPAKGKLVYEAKCRSCHGNDGEGQQNPDGVTYAYPPLWGSNSYNDGAGLYRLSRFAGFVHDNMPFQTASHLSPALTNEEAWDVAAFVNTQDRPHRSEQGDWPDVSKKPVDHPFGPYADGFSERQHKYGPFLPIVHARAEGKKNQPSK